MNRGDSIPQHLQQPVRDHYHRQRQQSRSPISQQGRYNDDINSSNVYSYGAIDNDRNQLERIQVDLQQSTDARYGISQHRLSPQKGGRRKQPSKTFNDDFEEVKKTSTDVGRKSDSFLMEQQRQKRLHKMDSIKRHGQDEAHDKQPFMASLKFKPEHKHIDSSDPSDDDQRIGQKLDSGAEINSKRKAHAMSILKGKSQRHLVVENSSSDSDGASDGNNTKPPLVLVNESKEMPADSIQSKQFPATSGTSVRLGTAVRAQQYQHQKRPAAIEVDFYNNPTILSRLILNEKYSAAMRRVYDFPRETYVWVCTKRLVTVISNSPLGRTASMGSIRKLPPSVHQGEGLDKAGSDRGPLITTSISKSPSVLINKDDKQEVVYSLRQLPIHVACANLRRTHDSKMKKLLNDLIANLIFANPEGAHQMDHNGRYPIHEAIWHGATAETISLFLLAKPSSLHLKDSKGRTLQEVNKFGPGTGNTKIEIQRILELDEQFWKQARKEAMFRLLRKSVKWPSDSSSIGSLSVLASSMAEDESITTSRPQVEVADDDAINEKDNVKQGEDEDDEDDDSDADSDGDSQGSEEALASLGSDDEEAEKEKRLVLHKKVVEPMKQQRTSEAIVAAQAHPKTEEDVEVTGVTPLSWDQLEARALASEQILMDMNEQYYEMSKKVEALSVLGHQHHSELVGEVTRLSRENNALNNNLHRLELILTRISDLGEDAFNKELRKACNEVASTSKSLMEVSSTESSYDSNEIEKNETKIRDKLGALSQNHFQQRERIRKLAHFVGKLVLQDGTTSSVKSAAQSDQSSTSSLSALTSRSAKSYWSQAKLKQDPLGPIVDHIPEKTIQARKNTRREEGDKDKALTDEEENAEVVDNLDDVFKLAAANDVHVSSRGKIVRLQSKKQVTHPTGEAVFGKDSTNDGKNINTETSKQDKIQPPPPGRAQRRNSILVRPTAAKAIADAVMASHKLNGDIDIPALIPDNYEFEPLKVSDLDERIFTR